MELILFIAGSLALLINGKVLAKHMAISIREYYTQGKELASENAYRLLRSAMVMKDKGNYGLAQSLILLAYEEATKAVYCSMIALGLVTHKDAKDVFKEHNPKVILFDKLFKEKVTIKDHDIRFNDSGENIAQIIRKALRGNAITKQHNDKKKAGFYVDERNNNWHSPSYITQQMAETLIAEYEGKVYALNAIAQILLREYDEVRQLSGFNVTFYRRYGKIHFIISSTSKPKNPSF